MTSGGAGCGVTEKARWNRAVCGDIHRGRRSGMGRIAKSPMARRHMDQAVKKNFVSDRQRITLPGTVRKALPAGHESSNARRRDWPAGTRMGGRMAIASVLKIDAGNRMGVRVPPHPPMNLKKNMFSRPGQNAVQAREDSILNPSPVHRWRRGLRLQVARRPVQVRRGWLSMSQPFS